MKFRFFDVEAALEYASTDGGYINYALINKKTGEVYYQSDMSGMDEVPEGAWDWDCTVSVPPKKELDLGSRLVFRFVRDVMPGGYDEVRGIFSRRRAYARYKDWLIRHDLLDKWYDYSNAAEEKVLREWCVENGIQLSD
jgi:hypothetical protein